MVFIHNCFAPQSCQYLVFVYLQKKKKSGQLIRRSQQANSWLHSPFGPTLAQTLGCILGPTLACLLARTLPPTLACTRALILCTNSRLEYPLRWRVRMAANIKLTQASRPPKRNCSFSSWKRWFRPPSTSIGTRWIIPNKIIFQLTSTTRKSRSRLDPAAAYVRDFCTHATFIPSSPSLKMLEGRHALDLASLTIIISGPPSSKFRKRRGDPIPEDAIHETEQREEVIARQIKECQYIRSGLDIFIRYFSRNNIKNSSYIILAQIFAVLFLNIYIVNTILCFTECFAWFGWRTHLKFCSK